MAVSRALRRLLRVRNLEEEQSRLALETAVNDLRRLEGARAAAASRSAEGRRRVMASARSGEVSDRLAGLEELEFGERRIAALGPHIEDAGQNVALAREDLMAVRTERRQAETLIEEATALQTLEIDRRSQQGLDDWFRNRRHRAEDEQARSARRSGETNGNQIKTEQVSASGQET